MANQVWVIITLFFPLVATALEWGFWKWGHRFAPERVQPLRALGLLTAGASLISFALSVFLLLLVVNGGEPIQFLPFGIPYFAFYLDALSVYFIFLVNVVAFISSWSAVNYLESYLSIHPQADPLRFHILFNGFHFTMLLVAMVDNLVVLWIAVEFTTLVSTMLVAYRQDRNALEAAWKYIIITSTGIIFALLGTMFLAMALPKLPPDIASSAMNWSRLRDLAGSLNLDFVKLSFFFILIGYGTKAGLAPMFTWLPDGHGEAPAPVSAMLSGVLLKSALYAILRFYTITNIATQKQVQSTDFTSNLLLGAGLLSLGMAVPFIIKTNPFKRVLAYHSLEHMGIITFGLGIGGELALFGALLHALNHALTKALMFLTFGRVQNEFEKCGIAQEDIRGVLKTMPWTSSVLFLGGLALVGSPPFNIFMSELIILWGAIEQLGQTGQTWQIIAIGLFLVSILLIFGGLVRHLGKMLLGPRLVLPVQEKMSYLLPLFLLLMVILVTGVTLFPLAELLRRSVTIVINGY